MPSRWSKIVFMYIEVWVGWRPVCWPLVILDHCLGGVEDIEDC